MSLCFFDLSLFVDSFVSKILLCFENYCDEMDDSALNIYGNDAEDDFGGEGDMPSGSKKEIHANRFAEIKEMLQTGDCEHRVKTHGTDGKKVSAGCWKIFHELYENNNKIESYYFCTICEGIFHSANTGGNTTTLNRHFKKCGKIKPKKPLTKKDKEKLKFAFAGFVSTDLRPPHAVECVGFKKMAVKLMQIGQENPDATPKELEAALPCRKTVQNGVHIMSEDARKFIAKQIGLAKNWEALTMVIDGWTDDHKHRSYFGVICLLAYVNESNGKIVMKKFTLQVKLRSTEAKKNLIYNFCSVLKTHENISLCR